jgi:hypothetical protein
MVAISFVVAGRWFTVRKRDTLSVIGMILDIKLPTHPTSDLAIVQVLD